MNAMMFVLVSGLAAILAAVDVRADVPDNPNSLLGANSFIYKTVDDVTLRLHVFSGNTYQQTPRPAIIFFFGGGFRQGSIEQFVPHSRILSNLGMVAVVADYRVLLRHGTTPAEAIEDGRDAIAWLRSQSVDLNIDPTRIVAAGGSAGGFLAAATAHIGDGLDPKRGWSAPNVLALFNPALGYPSSQWRRREGFEKQSPYLNLNDSSIPTFIAHGQADTVVPYSHAEKYCEKLQNLDGYCELHGYENAGHAFFNEGHHEGRYFKLTVAELIKFLAKFDYL